MAASLHTYNTLFAYHHHTYKHVWMQTILAKKWCIIFACEFVLRNVYIYSLLQKKKDPILYNTDYTWTSFIMEISSQYTFQDRFSPYWNIALDRPPKWRKWYILHRKNNVKKLGSGIKLITRWFSHCYSYCYPVYFHMEKHDSCTVENKHQQNKTTYPLMQ